MDNRVQSLLDAEWRKRPTGLPAVPKGGPPLPGWSFEVTPPFPTQWPPDDNTRPCYYGFATRFSPMLADGIYVAAPWGRAYLAPDGSPRFESLESGLRELGIQGMWPLNAEDQAAWQFRVPAQKSIESLRAIPEVKDATQIRAYYRVWMKGNGRIAKAIQPHHTAFFDWLR